MITDEQYKAIKDPKNHGSKTESLLGKLCFAALEMA